MEKTEEVLNEFSEILSIIEGFTKNELRNILRKVKKVKIKPDFKDVLIGEFGIAEYDYKEADIFFAKYSGQTVNIYEWCGDWWICEDDNFPITEKCFDIVIN